MLEVRNVTKVYGDGAQKVIALNDISLTVNRGDFIAVMGPSGSGKSTLLNVLGGLETVSQGQILLDGLRIDTLDENDFVEIRRDKIAYVFQQYHLIQSLSALENVLLPLVFCGKNGKVDKAREMLERVGLKGRTSHKPGQLSGGEQQRVAIARALVNEPSFILADEPTGNMDQKTGNQIMDIFDELNREGHTIIMVTHEAETAQHAGEIIMLQDGKVIH